MIKGITKNGDLKNILVNEDGSLAINSNEDGVSIKQTSDMEVTLNASILTLSTEVTSITIGKKVTMIMIANYSETSDVLIIVGDKTYQVGANLALELPINVNVNELLLSSIEADTKIQLVVKGVE